MELTLEQLLQSPRIKRLNHELSEALRVEDDARKRFRRSLDEHVRAEFINGEVVVHLPAQDQHTVAVKNFLKVLDTHVVLRKLGAVRSEQALTAFTRNDYCPDVCFWKKAKSKAFTAQQLIYPVPDFICEVLSPTTVEVDRGVKYRDYAAHGVGEYWMIDPSGQSIEQYLLRNGRYEFMGRFVKGTVRSDAVKGFSIPVHAIFDDDANVACLKRMLRT